MATFINFVIYISLVTCHLSYSKIAVSEKGGYNNIVVEISKFLNEEECPAILKGLKVTIAN